MERLNFKKSQFSAYNEHPAFFQLYLPEKNSKLLRIPPPFINNFNGRIPESLSLTNMAGRVWPAKIGFQNNELHITEGWQHWVSDHKLTRGDFVVLRYLQNSTFLVTAYGIDGCNKEVPTVTILKKGLLVVGRYSPAGGNIKFQKTFRTNFKNFVSIPKHVLKACTFTVDQKIQVRNNEGVAIMTQLRVTCDRIILGYSGLTRFWQLIGVQKGDKLDFEVVRENGNGFKEIVVTIRD